MMYNFIRGCRGNSYKHTHTSVMCLLRTCNSRENNTAHYIVDMCTLQTEPGTCDEKWVRGRERELNIVFYVATCTRILYVLVYTLYNTGVNVTVNGRLYLGAALGSQEYVTG